MNPTEAPRRATKWPDTGTRPADPTEWPAARPTWLWLERDGDLNALARECVGKLLKTSGGTAMLHAAGKDVEVGDDAGVACNRYSGQRHRVPKPKDPATIPPGWCDWCTECLYRLLRETDPWALAGRAWVRPVEYREHHAVSKGMEVQTNIPPAPGD